MGPCKSLNPNKKRDAGVLESGGNGVLEWWGKAWEWLRVGRRTAPASRSDTMKVAAAFQPALEFPGVRDGIQSPASP